ncbi:MAG: AMP-binding protein [Clostridia bacterium]
MKSILDYLENTALQFKDKVVFSDDTMSITYSGFVAKAKSVGTALLQRGCAKQPVAIFMDKSVNCLVAMFGALYCGGFYFVIDADMPAERIKTIFSVLNPKTIITQKSLVAKTFEFANNYSVLQFEDIVLTSENIAMLNESRASAISADPQYVLFTSGSTGTPKGTVVTHQNVISYALWFAKTFNISHETVFGNQSPFYFSMSVSDIYGTIITGATLHIIPKQYFSFPIKLVAFMNERKINTIYWVPSALNIVANLNLFKYALPTYLTDVLFAGEVMPTKQLNYWRSYLPNANYANLFGPTETTDICAYYKINRNFSDDETLPIGNACENLDVFLINENGELCKNKFANLLKENKKASECKNDKVCNTENSNGVEAKQNDCEEGELYVRGAFVAAGYYNNPEKTALAFVQNPLNKSYPEIVYKTGDICRYNRFGELEFLSRKDFQIKHLGYRIELGEIETAGNSIKEVKNCLCLFDKKHDSIYMVFEGNINELELGVQLAKKLPTYMCPSKLFKVKSMAHNQNGKIDRNFYMAEYLNK